MPFIDDVNAARAKADQARADMDVLVTQLTDTLYQRLRSLPALAWITDDVLHLAVQSFAMVAISETVTPSPASNPIRPSKWLT